MKKMIVWAALAAPLWIHAQSVSQKVEQLMNAYTEQQKFSGNVLIAEKGKLIFSRSYGRADREQDRLNEEHTEFRAASLTKMFTAVLIMQLVEQKKLQLNDPVSKYIGKIDASGKVTLKHLLSHTSGLKGHTRPGSSTLAEMIGGYQPEPASFIPGERFEYNNFNFILLAYIAQKRTGIAFPDLLKRNVLLKAGMTHSGIDAAGRKSPFQATGYVTDPATNQWVVTGNDKTIGAASGAGALFTTTTDLFKWSLHIGSPKLLSKKSWELLLTPVQPGYGLGWMIRNQDERTKWGHTGSIPGFIADFAWFPKENILITFLSNYQDLDGRKLEENLTAIVFNLPYQLPVQRKEIKLPVDQLQEYVGYTKSTNRCKYK